MIKPCPFCGGIAELVRDRSYCGNEVNNIEFVWTYTCGGKAMLLDFNVDGDILKYL